MSAIIQALTPALRLPLAWLSTWDPGAPFRSRGSHCWYCGEACADDKGRCPPDQFEACRARGHDEWDF